jgi:hypothetical protein
MLLAANMRQALITDQIGAEQTRDGRRVGEERRQADYDDQSQPLSSHGLRKLQIGISRLTGYLLCILPLSAVLCNGNHCLRKAVARESRLGRAGKIVYKADRQSRTISCGYNVSGLLMGFGTSLEPKRRRSDVTRYNS